VTAGGTDSRHYIHLSRHGVFRFLPISLALSTHDLHRFHSTDERLSLKDHERMVCTYIKGMAAFGSLAEQGSDAGSRGSQAKGGAHEASRQEL
jgi:acetylornithine deacetylase/succinyl-diaminopimelate desuccinylase-like protein